MTTNDTEHAEIFARMLTAAFDPEIVRCTNAIRSIADFDIPEQHRAAFLRFHSFITEPQPAYISAWRADERYDRKWYHNHVNGIIGDVRGALAAAHYHKANLAALEETVTALLAQSDFKSRMGNSTMGLGGTRKLDFEYQAFVLACRRALDYLAGAIACYFKTEANSFRSLPKAIGKKSPSTVASLINEAHARHLDDLAFVMAEGRQSVRNRIAHYEFVSAGCINLSSRGFTFVGGGEDLRIKHATRDMGLQEVLDSRLTRLHTCVDDLIDSFVCAARQEDSNYGLRL